MGFSVLFLTCKILIISIKISIKLKNSISHAIHTHAYREREREREREKEYLELCSSNVYSIFSPLVQWFSKASLYVYVQIRFLNKK